MAELKSNAEWKQWGKQDPLYGVSPWATKQKDGSSAWTEEEFYALGASDWEEFSAHWQRYGMNTESCLEIGCGAGRLTKQLAMSFDKVYAVDVSEHMISYAKKAIGEGNVEFSIIDGQHLPQSDCSVKSIFTFGVLQHLDSVEFISSYFREFYRVLDVGGTIMINIPLYQFPNDPGIFGSLMSSFYAVYRQLDNLQSSIKRGMGIKLMRWTPYPTKSLCAFLHGLGFRDVEFVFFPFRRHSIMHPFIFARK
jgi:2-polyprenyl-3-methyl-5-hydroxy-6-metoxy-1,4-benzoquinol methylase